MNVPVIKCAQCRKPVDTWRVDQNDMHRTTRFQVRCHGATEVCEIERFDARDIVEAVAFRTQAISAT